MKPRSKKQKGKKFEEQVAKLIHEYLFNYIDEYRKKFEEIKNEETKKFLKPARDFSSGNWNWNKSDIQLNLATEFFPFFIECKKWEQFKSIPIYNFLNEKKFLKTELAKIYFETEKKSPKNFVPIVVFSSNRSDILVLINLDRFMQVFDAGLILIKNFVLIGNNFIILNFEDFLKTYCENFEFYKEVKNDVSK